ncbi:MAG: hypothetical protein NC397_09285 [Clostridium sp.]|nr:hypothetical protein [Clostridium sp.]
MIAKVNGNELKFSITFSQLYALSAADIELYREFFVIYNQREKQLADKAILIYVAYCCANLENPDRLDNDAFFKHLDCDLQSIEKIYNQLFFRKIDYNMAKCFDRPNTNNSIAFPKKYELMDVEDYYAMYVLNFGIPDTTFWNCDIEFIKNIAYNKSAIDRYIDYQIERRKKR